MTEQTPGVVTPEEAQAIIDSVMGTGNAVFASRPTESGDISLILREGGGCEILSTMNPEMTNAKGVKIDMGSVAIRGMVALALFKIAHNKGLMAEVLTLVSKEYAENPPKKPGQYDA